MSNAENTTKQHRVVGRPWPKGVSGNPGGRPRNSLKSYVAKMLAEMSDEDKLKWLKENKVSPELMWQMGEGRPHQTQDVTTDGEKIEMNVNITDELLEAAKKELKKRKLNE